MAAPATTDPLTNEEADDKSCPKGDDLVHGEHPPFLTYMAFLNFGLLATMFGLTVAKTTVDCDDDSTPSWARCNIYDSGICDDADDSDCALEAPYIIPTQAIYTGMTCGLFATQALIFFAMYVIKQPQGNQEMVDIAKNIQDGSNGFLLEEYKYLSVFLIIVFAVITGGLNWKVGVSYAIGGIFSGLSGFIGMLIATRSNVRTAYACWKGGLSAGLKVAFRGGAVMGMAVTGMGLFGICFCYWLTEDARALAGYGAGGSSIALFARVAGGIYTKAADVGADLVGKVEAGLDEDDPNNPATIADNVGDNVGDIAGMGADLFESYVGSIIACVILGSAFYGVNGAALPLYIACAGCICGIWGCMSISAEEDATLEDLLKAMSHKIFFTGVVILGIVAAITLTLFSDARADTSPKCQMETNLVNYLAGSDAPFSSSAEIMDTLDDFVVAANQVGAGLATPDDEESYFAALTSFNAATALAGLGDGTCPAGGESGLSDAGDAISIAGGSFSQRDAEIYACVAESFGSMVFKGGECAQDAVGWRLFISILLGLSCGMLISEVTEYFTSHTYYPTQSIASAGKFGAGPVIIHGLGQGMLSTVVPLLLIIVTILGAYELGDTYAVSLTAVGMLSTLGVTMACDAYGPVADNAGGIAEMTTSMPGHIREITDKLDALGNTTAATGKGFANASAVLTALSTAVAFTRDGGIEESDVSLLDRYVISGVLLGALLPYVFSSLTMLAVGRAAEDMIREVRRQFKEIPGLREKAPGVKAEYSHCVAISTKASLVEMVVPGALAIFTPLIVGYIFGSAGLLGLLLGAIASGYLLGVMMSNTGGAWDNAKKYVEAGFLGEGHLKGSDTHAAAVAGDTVGDPFKDTSGPSLNILIKIQTRFALVFATAFPLSPDADDYASGDLPKYAIGLIMLGVLLLILAYMWTVFKRLAREKEDMFEDGFKSMKESTEAMRDTLFSKDD